MAVGDVDRMDVESQAAVSRMVDRCSLCIGFTK
jgi:hypothetical protein